MTEKKTGVFEVLSAVNVNKFTEKKQNLTYLTWSHAWAEVQKRFPNATYEIVKFDGLPYAFDEATGYMCYTKVTIEGITHEMWLPVMDGANKAMKHQSYTYKVKDWNESKRQNKQVFIDKTVQAATMFDINKTIMRCLVKNLAMFGLGLYIYAGEDLPQIEEEAKPAKKVMTDHRNHNTSKPASNSEPKKYMCEKCKKPTMWEKEKGLFLCTNCDHVINNNKQQ